MDTMEYVGIMVYNSTGFKKRNNLEITNGHTGQQHGTTFLMSY